MAEYSHISTYLNAIISQNLSGNFAVMSGKCQGTFLWISGMNPAIAFTCDALKGHKQLTLFSLFSMNARLNSGGFDSVGVTLFTFIILITNV